MNVLKAKSISMLGNEEKLFIAYTDVMATIEKLHRGLLDIVKFELNRNDYTDINSVQALLLFNISDSKLAAGELRTRGYYMGTNVSYNLKKLIEFGYVEHSRSRQDKRSVRVRLTYKGIKIHKLLGQLYQRHAQTVEKVGDINSDSMVGMLVTMEKLERFWYDQIRYRM